MIDITKLNEESKGCEVTYRTFGKREYGHITSWNEKFIFVRYHCRVDDNGKVMPRYGQTSEATSPQDLEWSTSESERHQIFREDKART